jgi:hypothetical protein
MTMRSVTEAAIIALGDNAGREPHICPKSDHAERILRNRIYGETSPRLSSLRRSSIASIRSSLRSRWTS